MAGEPHRRWLVYGGAFVYAVALALFAAAMLGKLSILQAILADDPYARHRLGPHGIPLIAHAKAGGPDAAEVVSFLGNFPAR